MVQATNDLILGIELNEQYSQLTYYHQSLREPMTMGLEGDGAGSLQPMSMEMDAEGHWQFWDGSRPKTEGRIYIEDLYGKTQREEPLEAMGQVFQPEELFAAYFGICFDRLKLLVRGATVYVMVTVRQLTERWSSILVAALEKNGLSRRQIFLQDYLSSFYYYTVNQRKELWSQDVALLEYDDEAILGYILHIDRSTKPAIAQAALVARQPMGAQVRADRGDQEWKKEKDRLFFELLKKVFERRNVSVSYLVGDYFNKTWAERSIQYLCHKRHAFQGRNLYSKGACYAAMERAGMIPGRGIIFGGCDMIDRNIGMEVRIRGKDKFYPLISAGINWYEAHHVCEFVLNHEREIRVISHPMSQGEPIIHVLRLPDLPSRPDRATRIRLTVYFTSPTCCHMEAEDLGFGGLYRSSGMVWSRAIYF